MPCIDNVYFLKIPLWHNCPCDKIRIILKMGSVENASISYLALSHHAHVTKVALHLKSPCVKMHLY
jgi:hypothetical protein